MKMSRCNTSFVPPHSALLVALLLALPLTASAQSTPASSTGTVPMDMSAMPGMAAPTQVGSTTRPATKAPGAKERKKYAPAESTSSSHEMKSMSDMDHDSMPGMDHAAMPGMNHAAMPGMNHDAGRDMGSIPGMTMGPMQGGSAPADARSDDYSDGVAGGSVHGLHMHGSAPFGMLLIDQLEAFHGRDANGQSWEAEGWYGNDENKLWVRTEGERSRGRLEDGDLEAFWNHNVATFWSTQLGLRHDAGFGPAREWAAFGIQGLATYWFDIEATAYVGPSGRTAARLRAGYELLFTQRLILRPELEVNLHGKSDAARGIGSGLTDAKLGLRLRYEVRREFAPYIGVVWTRRFAATADFVRDEHQAVFDRQWVAGVRIWF
ncbi:copper resistance protein B [Rhodanobacter glycinis]|uniref:copper resistance protein B n=1 Tax=Rhodanobacter glycinis TaxID=582702 RepID=UPI00112D5798|nr:copper resistance protein B [Rhodanobacter glycinis]TPG51047.1 copper resistance protein B [Rhodanobacter glycinis]